LISDDLARARGPARVRVAVRVGYAAWRKSPWYPEQLIAKAGIQNNARSAAQTPIMRADTTVHR
jgi:hypothetical protein